jgi:hypothetical protein
VDERRWRIGSLFEWLAAAIGVAGLLWLLSVPLQNVIGRRVDAAFIEVREGLPPGVPTGASSVPVLLLMDGRAVRVGELESTLRTLVGDGETVALLPTRAAAADQSTRAYGIDGIRFFVVCERPDRGSPMRVSGIFVP